MKANLEKIEPGFGSSFSIRKFDRTVKGERTNWHFHPEYEIVFISSGRGKRHIGDHISHFENGDLIFLGPDLPHFGFTEDNSEEHFEIVVQMKEEFLGREFFLKPEMHAIKQLFERSRQGVSFSGATKKRVGDRLGDMIEMGHFERLIELLSVLQDLAKSTDYELLNASGFGLEVNPRDQERIQIVYQYVKDRFQGQISLEEVAGSVNMSVPAFCRYFKKLTQKTFIQFVNEYRIAHACKLLSAQDMSIAGVSYESGFKNLSHFNRQFRLVTGVSPRDYRNNQKKIVTN